MSKDSAWQEIFEFTGADKHDFSKSAFEITAEQIHEATARFTHASEKEPRILCKQDTRESRPKIFQNKGLFLLPIKNGTYAVLKGEGYVDIPEITSAPVLHKSALTFNLDSSSVGDSEMQHLDFAYASSVIRTFLNDDSLVLTIRGRKYTPEFSFSAGSPTCKLKVSGVQTEVDAGYEGKEQIVLIEAKNTAASNTIIRQLYYPFRQWQKYTEKQVKPVFFERNDDVYSLWEFTFEDKDDYNSIRLVKSDRYEIV
jgi:hypothetical protein